MLSCSFIQLLIPMCQKACQQSLLLKQSDTDSSKLSAQRSPLAPRPPVLGKDTGPRPHPQSRLVLEQELLMMLWTQMLALG